MRIAFFGGTFDPIHRGHLAIARAAADQFGLDLVLIAPAGRQPLKPEGSTAGYEDRLAMVRLACQSSGDARLQASNLDSPNVDGTPNYTVDTLTRLAAEQPSAELFVLTGADAFAALAHWREPYRLLALAEWIVLSRPGFPLNYPEGLTLTPVQEARVHLLNSVHEDVAATHLRTRLQQGDSCEDLLAPSVAGYIAKHSLYR